MSLVAGNVEPCTRWPSFSAERVVCCVSGRGLLSRACLENGRERRRERYNQVFLKTREDQTTDSLIAITFKSCRYIWVLSSTTSHGSFLTSRDFQLDSHKRRTPMIFVRFSIMLSSTVFYTEILEIIWTAVVVFLSFFLHHSKLKRLPINFLQLFSTFGRQNDTFFSSLFYFSCITDGTLARQMTCFRELSPFSRFPATLLYHETRWAMTLCLETFWYCRKYI